MAVSHKDWELLNSGIWLAEIDIDRGIDFPSRPASRPVKSCKLKHKNIDNFLLKIHVLNGSGNKPGEKKSGKNDEQTCQI